MNFEEWRLRRLRREVIDLADENRRLGPLLREVERLREELAARKTG